MAKTTQDSHSLAINTAFRALSTGKLSLPPVDPYHRLARTAGIEPEHLMLAHAYLNSKIADLFGRFGIPKERFEGTLEAFGRLAKHIARNEKFSQPEVTRHIRQVCKSSGLGVNETLSLMREFLKVLELGPGAVMRKALTIKTAFKELAKKNPPPLPLPEGEELTKIKFVLLKRYSDPAALKAYIKEWTHVTGHSKFQLNSVKAWFKIDATTVIESSSACQGDSAKRAAIEICNLASRVLSQEFDAREPFQTKIADIATRYEIGAPVVEQALGVLFKSVNFQEAQFTEPTTQPPAAQTAPA